MTLSFARRTFAAALLIVAAAGASAQDPSTYPNQPLRMLPAYDSGDHLHPNDAGMRAMAEAIPLRLFRHARLSPVR